MASPQSGRLSITPGSRILHQKSPSGDDSVRRRLKDAGFVEESIKRRDKAALIVYIAKLEAEIFDYQHHMGLLILEKKEMSSKAEEAKASVEAAELKYRHDQSAHAEALVESRKREENLKKALGIEKECIASGPVTAAMLDKRMNELLLEHEESSPSSLESPSFPSHLKVYLYSGYFLSRWGARMWEFSVSLYMISIWPDSLLLTAVYGVVESGSTALFGPFIGEWVNRLDYLRVLQLWLVLQNLSFVVAGVSVVLLLAYSDLKNTSVMTFVLLVSITNISGAIGVLSTLAGTILIEREWVVVMSENQPPDLLTRMNSIIRRIDLVCKLFAPVISGFIISFGSLIASAVTLAVLCTISGFLQYWLLMSVFKGIPALVERNLQRISKSSLGAALERSSPAEVEDSTSLNLSEKIAKIPFISSWRLYLKQVVVLPGVSLALLYFTVLSFGSLMTATLEWEGTPVFVIGIARGISAVIGISATFVYPALQSHISTLRTGLWSIWSQWMFLVICVGSTLLKNGLVSAYMLMGGVAASRLGLWMFDLAVIQQMQDNVPESDRMIVGGVQNALQSFLDLMGYVMGIIVSNPEDFWKLILLSFAASTVAVVIYTLHVYRIRKHLIHFEKLLPLMVRQ